MLPLLSLAERAGEGETGKPWIQLVDAVGYELVIYGNLWESMGIYRE